MVKINWRVTYLDNGLVSGLGADCDDLLLAVHQDCVGLHVLAFDLKVLSRVDDYALLYHENTKVSKSENYAVIFGASIRRCKTPINAE